ncbi:ribbon-helix-helix protein, CopG family [Burkholderia vietnamiensis]|uniref:ribbon-helix-helix protein, CopG family n=1 Tax=Burkholderia TaxID=32008 RepID=UPI000538925B|nr:MULTISPECIES: ribbon-helix-helix protein, CopG family [Burkholderia]KGV89198.1 ribbon-helix-helix, copG family protein [Burkholderia pseudomallei ABCPW 30]MBR8228499.1 ribbon-helix-helix protein, CopG family [Burkholderia vietnamiensis]
MELPHPDDVAPYELDPADAEAAREEAATLARLRREAKAREIAAEIQHGKTPSKKTVATQVRILEDQLADLKHIAGLTGQNISGILRELIAEYILRMREDEYVGRSLDWARGGREAVERMRKAESVKPIE